MVDVYAPTVSKNCFPELMSEVNIRELCEWLPRDIRLRDSLGMLSCSLSANRVVDRFKDYDVILAHGQPSNWLAFNAKRKHGIPYISYLHQPNRFLYPRKVDIDLGYDVNPNYQLLERLHSFRGVIEKVDKISVKTSSCVLTNSKWIKKQVDKIYKVDSIVCYPGVDEKFFKKTYKGRSDPPYILSTNRHYPQKRLDYVILSLPRILKKKGNIHYKITGSFTSYTCYLKKLSEKLGVRDKVNFTGRISEKQLLDTYQNAYLYAYTSPEEDFGLGPLEAGACSVPSVVWDHAGPKETVIDGVTGFRAKPYSIKDLAEKQIRLLNETELRNRMGKKASKMIKNKFNWKNHTNIIENITEKIRI